MRIQGVRSPLRPPVWLGLATVTGQQEGTWSHLREFAIFFAQMGGSQMGRYVHCDRRCGLELMCRNALSSSPRPTAPGALTRTGQGDCHHPALPLMWLVVMSPRSGP